MKNKLMYVLLLLVLVSCKDKQRNNSLVDLINKEAIYPQYTILNDTSIFNHCFKFEIYKDYLIVLNFIDDKFIHIYDKNTGRHIKSVLSQGRGPGEVLRCRTFSLNKNAGKISFYNDEDDKYTGLFIDSVFINDNESKYIEHKYASGKVFEIFEANDITIGVGEFNKDIKCRFKLFDINTDSVFYRYNSFPDLPELKFENIGYAFQMNNSRHFSSINNKLVCAGNNGAILEIFDILPTSISLNKIKVFDKPYYELNNRNIPQDVSGRTIKGFYNVYITSKNIYATYVGDIEYKGNHRIIEFDLEGNPLRCFELDDIEINKFCVDESENQKRIYMMVESENKDNHIIYITI